MLGPSTSETPLLIAPTAAPRYRMSSNPVDQSQQRFVDQHVESNSRIKIKKVKGATVFYISQ